MNRNRGTGLVLIIAGATFLATAGGRAAPSTIGMIAGALLILAGVLRMLRPPRV